jgi:hypothetical protein
VLRNLLIALEAAGATLDDVAKITTYVVDQSWDALEQVLAATEEVLGDPRPLTADTLGVSGRFGCQTCSWRSRRSRSSDVVKAGTEAWTFDPTKADRIGTPSSGEALEPGSEAPAWTGTSESRV